MKKVFKIFIPIILIALIISCSEREKDLYLDQKVILEFCDKYNEDKIRVEIYSLSDGSLSFVKAMHQGYEYTLPQVVSADGARYDSGRDVSIWLVGDKLYLDKGDNDRTEFFLENSFR